MNNTNKSIQLLLNFLFLVALSTNEIISASEIDEIRNYLNVRDAAVMFRNELQRAATDASGSPLLLNPQGEQEAAANIAAIKEHEARFRKINTPLSIYYADRLSDILLECNALYPHFVKRRALNAHTQVMFKAASPSPTIPPPKEPVDLPPVITEQNTTSIPPSLENAEAIIDSSPASESEALLAQRRAFFQSIGLRTLIPSKSIVKMPPMQVAGAASPSVSVATTPPTEPTEGISFGAPPAATSPVNFQSETPIPAASPAQELQSTTTASASAQPKFPQLPKAAATPPAAFTPLEPWPQGDPQIRNEPGMRPLAVMIENHNQARPQTGLHEAEIVYEIPVEGGITRFMALYYHVPQVVGPVRSCREYFVDRALEVNALYVHCGGSPNGYKYLDLQKVFSIDEISNGSPFYRDNTRKPPHNLYAKPQQIIELMNKRYPMELPYQRLPLLYGSNPTGGDTTCIGLSIRYHSNYTVTYKLNPTTGRYDRYMNGTQHLDRLTLQPVSPGTVILQVANMRVIDEIGRQEINFIGEGRGIVLYGGTAAPVIWKKSAPREFTKFYDVTGKPFVFSNKSPVWIQVIAPTNQVVFDPRLPNKMVEFLNLETKTAKDIPQEASKSDPKALLSSSNASANFSKGL